MVELWKPDLGTLKDFIVQANPGRVTSFPSPRTSGYALKLTTNPTDTGVAGSGAMERSDVYQRLGTTAAPVLYREVEHWWAHSVMFPTEFTFPMGPAYMVLDFHNYPDAPGMPNFILNFVNWNGDNKKLGQLQLQRFIGDPLKPTERSVIADETPKKNFWYDFVYHVRWTDKNDGFFTAWVNGKLVMDHTGPTLYQGGSVYLKLANYHFPDGKGLASTVIHDRVVLGPTRDSVTI